MEWNYPEISLEDVLKFVKGFVDMLILASGYQSSGRPAYWDVKSMKRVLQWSLFFEKLIRNLRSKDEYGDSLLLLEAELSLLSFHPHFPRWLAHLSVETLSKAKELVVTHLVQTLPLMREHLVALLKAVSEIDLDELQESEIDYLDTYLGELMLQSASYEFAAKEKGFSEGSGASSPDIATDIPFRSWCSMDNLAACTIEEILRRQNAVSFVSKAETCLEALSKSLQHGVLINSNNSSLGAQRKLEPSMLCDEHEVEFSTWNNWRSKGLSYFLDKETIRSVSGADKWKRMLNHLVSLPYISSAISKQYSEVSLLKERSPIPNAVDRNTKEYGIIEYLTQLLSGKLHLLWNVTPALAAAAIPTWSPLFRSYLIEIEDQFKQVTSANRYDFVPAPLTWRTQVVNSLKGSGVCIRSMFMDPSTLVTLEALQNEYVLSMSPVMEELPQVLGFLAIISIPVFSVLLASSRRSDVNALLPPLGCI
uniref:Uncharacterized protein n=1 Tax=Kalanchoe fedtschenkoi TaxID=63787 RepID=A0A7N0TNL9_KALFE